VECLVGILHLQHTGDGALQCAPAGIIERNGDYGNERPVQQCSNGRDGLFVALPLAGYLCMDGVAPHYGEFHLCVQSNPLHQLRDGDRLAVRNHGERLVGVSSFFYILQFERLFPSVAEPVIGCQYHYFKRLFELLPDRRFILYMAVQSGGGKCLEQFGNYFHRHDCAFRLIGCYDV
jgi:hypothetical protein